MRIKIHATLLMLAVLGCRAQEHMPAEHDAEPSLVIRGARVFDGERLLPVQSVVVRDGIIVELVRDEDAPDGDWVIDGTGCTLLPGLIDAHCHVTDERDLARALVFGVTTELDMMIFLPKDHAQRLRGQLDAGGRNDIADLRSAIAPVTCSSGLGPYFLPDTPVLASADEAQAFVDARLEEGADYVKIMYDDGYAFGIEYPNLTPEMLVESVRAAHARNRLAVVHVTSLRGAREAVGAKADGLVHVFADEPPDAALCDDAARSGMFLVATLSTIQGGFEDPSGAQLTVDPRLSLFLSGPVQENLNKGSQFPGRRGSFSIAKGAVERLHDAGVVVLAGTDVPNAGTAHGVSMHGEIELLVEAGLSPVDALAAATSRPATCFGLDDRGRVAPGLRADLLLVRGDPTTNIRDTRNIVAVVRGGVLVDREAFRASIVQEANER